MSYSPYSFSPWENLQTRIGLGENPDQFARVTSPVRNGTYAGRFTVHDGDVFLGTSGERALVVHSGASGTHEPIGSDRWYAWSLYIPSDFVDPGTANWINFQEWHSNGSTVPGSYQPPIAFFIYNGGIQVNMRTGHIPSPDQYAVVKTLPVVKPYPKATWIDFKMHAVWQSTTAGSLQIWYRTLGTSWTQVADLPNTPTLQEQNGNTSDVYIEEGLYRNATFSGTGVLYHDAFRIGGSDAAVTYP
jgi:hypothetical protein